jgi:hypothetical protein
MPSLPALPDVRNLVPRLWRDHPNFFVIYAATAAGHLWFAITGLLQQQRFAGDGYQFVTWVARPWVWGVAYLLVWVLLTLGAYWRWSYGQAGLALALFLALSRGLLLELSGAAGFGIGPWFIIAACMYVQLAEPTIYPGSQHAYGRR